MFAVARTAQRDEYRILFERFENEHRFVSIERSEKIVEQSGETFGETILTVRGAQSSSEEVSIQGESTVDLADLRFKRHSTVDSKGCAFAEKNIRSIASQSKGRSMSIQFPQQTTHAFIEVKRSSNFFANRHRSIVFFDNQRQDSLQVSMSLFDLSRELTRKGQRVLSKLRSIVNRKDSIRKRRTVESNPK